MLNLSEEQKRMFYTSGYCNEYILTFPDIDLVIDNEKLNSETPVITESICDEEEFTLEGCIASSMEFEVSEILADEITGLEFTVQIQVQDETGKVVLTVPMGTFRADEPVLVDDKDYKKVTAYDRMYDASVDAAEWYNAFFADEARHTVKETRESLLGWLGIPFVEQQMPNDDVLLEKTIETAVLAGTDVLRALCVVNGGFGCMNRLGQFEVTAVSGAALFPEDSLGEEGNLYPSETLYPEDDFGYLGVSDGETLYPEYRSTRYEEYMTMPITCLNIRGTSDDLGVTVGTDLSNPYVITSNFFLYGKKEEELQKIGKNILRRIEGIAYRPNTTTLDGLPYMEVGDAYILEKKRDFIESCILSRTLSGIQALKDTYEAKGNRVRANEVSASDEMIQLKGRTLVLRKSIDGVSVELKDFAKDTKSQFQQTDESIVLKVDSKGNLAEVALGVDADDPSATKFTVTAKNIELTAEEVISILSGGTIELSAGKGIDVTSPNLTITKEGDMSAKSLHLNGGDIDLGDGIFTVDSRGNATARSINITGGTINIQATEGSDNEIMMENLVITNATGGELDKDSIDAFGNGKPSGTDFAFDTIYLDLDSGTVYTFKKYFGWIKHSQYNFVAWKVDTVRIKPGEGFVCTTKIGTTLGGHVTETEVGESTYSGGISCYGNIITERGVTARESITTESTIKGARVESDNDIAANGYLSAKEGLYIKNAVLVTDSTVMEFANEDPGGGSATMASGQIRLPATGINPTRPVNVCNGDYSANPFKITAVAINPGSQEIVVDFENMWYGGARFTYSYWMGGDQ